MQNVDVMCRAGQVMLGRTGAAAAAAELAEKLNRLFGFFQWLTFQVFLLKIKNAPVGFTKTDFTADLLKDMRHTI